MRAMIRSLHGKSPQLHPTAFVSEAAYLVGDVEVGEHPSIVPGVVLRAAHRQRFGERFGRSTG